MALLGRHERGGEFGDRAQRLAVACLDGAMGMHQEHRITEPAALRDHRGQPAPQALGILDVATLDRPLDAARV